MASSSSIFLIYNISCTLLLFLAITFSTASSSRTLLEDSLANAPDGSLGVVTPATPGGSNPVIPSGTPTGSTPILPATNPVVGSGQTTTGPVGGGVGPDHTLSFFMHDILGGTNPSARAMTGVVTNPAVNGQVPFAKPNGAVLPVNNGVPGNNGNNGILNNNNLPFLTGLGGPASNVIQSNNNNNNNFNGFTSVNGGQLPQGTALQQLMFGTLTVFDDELTEGHDLGSGLIGKAQGFYITSSIDGNSQTMAFTVMFESGSYSDSLTLFGVHRTAVAESQLAIMGGTGKYLNAKGTATVKTFPATNQHNTDGVETLLQITVYLAY